MMNATFTISLAACVGWLIVLLFSRETKRPPGPRRLLFLGNTLQIPSTLQWLTFSKWAKEYGDIVYLEVFGQPLVLLNTHKAAKDLLEHRSSIYSDRPRLEMADLCGFDKTFVLYSAHDNWRQQRKIVTQDLGPRMLPRYHAFQEAEARLLAKNVIDDPPQLEGLVKRRVGTIIIRIAYGHYVSGNDDPFLTLGKASMEIFSRASASGVWLVDLIPALKYLPSWFPGAGFITTAQGWREIVHKAAWDPYIWSKHSYESGSVLLPNTCSTALEAVNGTLPRNLEEQVVWALCTMMAGGMDTSMISTLNLFLEMMLNREVQVKAQNEIDSVIGRHRLPTIADRQSLPYVRSIVTEIFRLNTAVPLSIAHALREDDVYDGVHLPKGSIVIPNVWHMLHDPAVFTNPMRFDPDRYQNLDSEMAKVTDVAFGFGRRVCPGKAFGENTVFAFAATLLATCDIFPAVDENGREVIPNVAYSSGVTSFPSRFDCNIRPRSNHAYELLLHSAMDAPDSSLTN